MNSERLLERFLQYVKIDTTAVEESGRYPSSDGQFELGKLLVAQLNEMGAADVQVNEFGIVMATVPGNVDGAPVVAFNAHLDTSPETSGANVKPNVIRDFDGKDIVLSGDSSQVITAATCAELPNAKGKTIITTDGTTLLGGDDKAGVAIMMELANYLIENPDIAHGPVRLLFTCDEEIGHGVDHVDIDAVAATVCYTFDGGGQNMVDQETFSADMALVTVTGVNIHPSIGKGRMVNAIRVASDFINAMPADVSPECTDGRDGFMHPYVMDGGVAQSTIKVLLRDFETNQLVAYADQLKRLADEVAAKHAGSNIDVQIVKQYRNMAEGLVSEPRAVSLAVAAHEALGRKPDLTIIRGGTDGSQLTEKGLPTPNLSSGQHNIHSPLEWACLDEMVAACEVGVELVKQWAKA
jgi:tripeptide aminopeptidase